ncbi:hypothetical protein LB505_001765 [Fusarium chuoi]|nr:hypothetical protein LB505_001765 [Fusarium chuoi]
MIKPVSPSSIVVIRITRTRPSWAKYITTYIFVFPLWDCYAKAWGKLGGLPAEAAASTGRAII